MIDRLQSGLQQLEQQVINLTEHEDDDVIQASSLASSTPSVISSSAQDSASVRNHHHTSTAGRPDEDYGTAAASAHRAGEEWPVFAVAADTTIDPDHRSVDERITLLVRIPAAVALEPTTTMAEAVDPPSSLSARFTYTRKAFNQQFFLYQQANNRYAQCIYINFFIIDLQRTGHVSICNT